MPAVMTSAALESATAAAAAASDDCCQVCLMAPRAGVILVPYGHARFWIRGIKVNFMRHLTLLDVVRNNVKY